MTVIGRIYTTGAGDKYHLRADCHGLTGGQDAHRSRPSQVHPVAALDSGSERLTDTALDLRWNTLRLVLATLALPYDRRPGCEERRR